MARKPCFFEDLGYEMTRETIGLADPRNPATHFTKFTEGSRYPG